MARIDYIIGIDIGTSTIKGALYSSEGEYFKSSSITYNSYVAEDKFYEQDPEDWIDGFVEVLRDLLVSGDIKENLQSISISTQGGTTIPVDKNLKPLCKAIVWLDSRSNEIFNRYHKSIEQKIRFYEKTGMKLNANLSFMHLYWLNENRKELFNRIYKILYVNDYLLLKVAGNNIQDPSNASITSLFNIIEGKWDDDILKIINLNKNYFSEVKESGKFVGYLNEEIRLKLGIKSNVRIINGGHDQYCAGLGAGILDESDILLATGTAWVIFKMLSTSFLESDNFFTIGRNIIKNKFGLIYSIPVGGASLKWFAKSVMKLDTEYALFKYLSNNINIMNNIKNSIIFIPYLIDFFVPNVIGNKKASFINIEIGHSYLDLTKAIMEGIGFQLKEILDVMGKKQGYLRKIKMVGGAARSDIWPRVISDITGLDILIPKNKDEDFATKGAAIIAGYGAGIFSSLPEGYSSIKTEYNILKPDSVNVKFYRDKYRLFIRERSKFYGRNEVI